MKTLSVLCPALLMLTQVAPASTYVYSTNFESYIEDDDLAGQFGWTVNDTTDQYSAIVGNTALNIDDPNTTSKVFNFGDASISTLLPAGSSIRYSQSAVGVVGSTGLTFDFLLSDSYEVGFANRDVFGFSFSNSSGNVLAIDLVPTQLAASDLNAVGDAAWSFNYRVGTGTRQALQMNLVGGSVGPSLNVVEARRHDLSMTLNPNSVNANLTDLTLTVRNISPTDPSNTGFATIVGTTTLNLAGTTAIDTLNFNWLQSTGNTDFGSNSMWVDNLAMVPEPSSALLACVAGMGLVLRRRRA